MRSFICVLLIGLGLLAFGSTAAAQVPFASDLCALTPFHLEGQAHSLIGMGPQKDVYAKRQDQPATPGPIDAVPLDLTALGLGKSVSSADAVPVAILIVDDFTTPGQPPPGTPLKVTHGEYVEALFLKLLNGDPDHMLHRVNIADGDFSASDIKQQISGVLDGLEVKRVVLNMSFAFVPCISSEQNFDFSVFLGALKEGTSLETYALSLSPVIDVQGLLKEATGQNYNGNALGQFIDDGVNGDNLIAVASAGNYGDVQAVLDPLAPASWPNVIAVSADVNGDTTVRNWDNPNTGETSVSNAGDVMVAGGWYDFDDLNGNTIEDQGMGTSFAAPLVSVAGAEYLSNPNQSAQTFVNTFEQCYNKSGSVYGYYVVMDVIQGNC